MQMMQEMWVRSLGWEDPLEKGGRHGYLLQCSCLKNSMDRGHWRASVHSVSKSWTLLEQLSTDTHIRKIPCVVGQLSPYSTTTALAHPRAYSLQQEKPLQ